MLENHSKSKTCSREASKRVDESLAAIHAKNHQWHAVSNLFTEQAVAQAKALDQYAAQGKQLGKLHGLPYVVKELISLKGQQTPFGSNAYDATKAQRNAPVIDRLTAEGAVLIGTAHMVEFAIGSWGTNSVKGTPWNPADPKVHRVPGGSSSGSAVAVAASLVPAAIGSDTGGSIRIPASLCGVVGFKPSYNLIPTDGVEPLGPTFDTLGPITRSVEDARRLTEVMAQRDLSHPPVSFEGLRVAVVSSQLLKPIDDEIAAAFAEALARLEACGAMISEIELPLSFPEFQRLNGDIVAYEVFQHIGHIAQDPKAAVDANIRNRVLAGRDITLKQYAQDLDELIRIRAEFGNAFSDYDILALPGTPICATPLSEVDESQIPMSRYTRIANCLDLCAISLPLARSSAQLPIGWQFCAPTGCDAYLLALAQEVELDEVLGQEMRLRQEQKR